jgi:hypothetical protein
MFFIVYKTTNTINNKIYVGIHKQKKGFSPTDFDGYYGSGEKLKDAISKYGCENFIRETLYVYDDLEKAKIKEKEIVDEQFILRNDTYNISEGGQGGNTTLGLSEAIKKQISQKRLITKIKNGTLKDSEQTKTIKSEVSKRRVIDKPHTIPNNKGRKHIGEKLLNMQTAFKKKIGKYKWITNGKITFLHNVNNKLPEEFYYGRGSDVKKCEQHTEETKRKISEKIKGDISYNNGKKNIKMKMGDVPPPGFVRGMLQDHGNKIWINDGVLTKKHNVGDIMPNGWKKGRIKK